jgi:hypothetical protein
MAVATFDFTNLRIILPAGDVTIDVERDLYSAWKRAVNLSPANMGAPPAFRPSVGGDPLSPGIDAGAYFFLQNQDGWRIRPAEADATVTVVGNLVGEDSSLPLTVPTIGAFTVLLNGLQPITQNVDTILTSLQDTTYDGAVTIDTFSGTAGTEFPIGTKSEPVLTLADAVTIASNLNVREIDLIGTIALTQAHQFWKFKGLAAVAEIALNGQDVSGTIFEGIGLSGDVPVLSQRCVLLNGRISPAGVTDFTGAMAGVVFDGNLTLQAGTTIIANCVSNISGVSRPTIDAQGNLVDLSIRKWSGGLNLRNISNAGTNVSVDIDSGTLDLDATCTSGTVVVRGVGTLIDNSGSGCTVIKDGFVDGLDVKLIKALDAGNVTVTGSSPFVVEVLDPDDNVTPIARFDVSADGRTRTRTL